MSTTLTPNPIVAPTGKSLYGRWRRNGVLVTQGAVTESPAGSGIYPPSFTAVCVDTVSPTVPCDIEVREATDPTTFDASVIVWGPRIQFWVKNSLVISEPILGNLDMKVSDVSGGGPGGGDLIESYGESVSSTDL